MRKPLGPAEVGVGVLVLEGPERSGGDTPPPATAPGLGGGSSLKAPHPAPRAPGRSSTATPGEGPSGLHFKHRAEASISRCALSKDGADGTAPGLHCFFFPSPRPPLHMAASALPARPTSGCGRPSGNMASGSGSDVCLAQAG